jgi:general secretion pathway protein B
VSYILDALRKAERERRGGGPPTLDTVHAAPLQVRRRWWPWALAGLVLVNLAGLVVLGRGPLGSLVPEKPVAMTSAAPAAPDAPAPASPAVAETPDPPPALAPPRMPATPTPGEAPPSGRVGQEVAPSMPSRAPVPVETPSPPPAMRPVPSPPSAPPPAASDAAAAPPAMAPVVAVSPPATTPPVVSSPSAAAPDPRSPAIPEPSGVGSLPPASPAEPAPVTAGPAATLPGSFRDAVARMTLDVLVYSEHESGRFVFINGRKHVEGQSVEGTVVVEAITREGALLGSQGERVLLRPKSNPYLQ